MLGDSHGKQMMSELLNEQFLVKTMGIKILHMLRCNLLIRTYTNKFWNSNVLVYSWLVHSDAFLYTITNGAFI